VRLTAVPLEQLVQGDLQGLTVDDDLVQLVAASGTLARFRLSRRTSVLEADIGSRIGVGRIDIGAGNFRRGLSPSSHIHVHVSESSPGLLWLPTEKRGLSPSSSA